MKRIIIFILVFILLFGLTACSSDTGDTPYVEPPQNTSAIETEVISTENTDIYIGNKSSKILHSSLCCTLPLEKNRVYFNTRNEAAQYGYKPCGNCNP